MLSQDLTCPAAATAGTSDTEQTTSLLPPLLPAHGTPAVITPLVPTSVSCCKPSSLSVTTCLSGPIPAGPLSSWPMPGHRTVSSLYRATPCALSWSPGTLRACALRNPGLLGQAAAPSRTGASLGTWACTIYLRCPLKTKETQRGPSDPESQFSPLPAKVSAPVESQQEMLF